MGKVRHLIFIIIDREKSKSKLVGLFLFFLMFIINLQRVRKAEEKSHVEHEKKKVRFLSIWNLGRKNRSISLN